MNDVIQEFDTHVALEDLSNDVCDSVISLGEYLMTEMDRFDEEFLNEEIIEEGEGITKISETGKNIFAKLIKYIKNFFAFIGRFIKGIIDKLFKKDSKIKETADQVAAEVIGDVPDPENDKPENVKFEAAPGSVIKSTNLSVIAKDFQVKILKDKFEMKPYGFKGGIIKRHKVAGQPMTNPIQKMYALEYIENASFRKEFNDIVTDFLEIPFNLRTRSEYDKNTIIDEMVSKMSKWESRILGNAEGRLDTPIHRIKAIFMSRNLEDLQRTYREMSEITKKLNKMESSMGYKDMTTDDNIFKASGKIKILMSKITSAANIITYGCNQFMRTIKGMHLIDKRYINTVKDINTLGKFVNKLIEVGIPSTYVAYNCWCVMAEEFDDKEYFSHKRLFKGIDGPRWGQTRVVFLPTANNDDYDKSSVVKVALNGAGIRANKIESDYYKESDRDIKDVLARPINSFADATIMTMERLETCKGKKDVPEYSRAAAIVADTLAKQGSLTRIRGDIHYKNVGKDADGKFKCIDYAS